jgi:hypothetical protein
MGFTTKKNRRPRWLFILKDAFRAVMAAANAANPVLLNILAIQRMLKAAAAPAQMLAEVDFDLIRYLE